MVKNALNCFHLSLKDTGRYNQHMSAPNQHTMFLTYKEAAHETRLSVSLVRKLVRNGSLKVVKFGRSARIPRAELEKLACGF